MDTLYEISIVVGDAVDNALSMAWAVAKVLLFLGFIPLMLLWLFAHRRLSGMTYEDYIGEKSMR